MYIHVCIYTKIYNIYIYIYIYICIYTKIYKIYMYIYIYIYIKLDNRIYSYTVNVNLMLICIELSELIFIVNMPENSRYLR